MSSSQRAGLSMSRIDVGRDSLQMGIVDLPSRFTMFDSQAYVDDFLHTYFAQDATSSPPTGSTPGQQQPGGNDDGVLGKIKKVLHDSGIYVTGTDPFGDLQRDLIIGAVAVVLIGVGVYVMSKVD